MKTGNVLKLLAVTAVTAMLMAGCGASNSAPAKEEAVTETAQTTAEEADPADEAVSADRAVTADTAIAEAPSVVSQGETASEAEAVEETTAEAAQAAETEQAEIVTAEPQEGDTVVIVYEGNEIEAAFRNIAEGPEYPQESQGEYIYDVLGMKCIFEQAVAPGRIEYEKLPEEWQSMARTVYMINKQESEQDAVVLPEPQEGDVTTVIREDGKEITVTFQGMDGDRYVYDAEGNKVTTSEVLEKGAIPFKDLPMGWTEILSHGY